MKDITMKNFTSKATAICVVVSALATVCTSALAQQARMAEAAHKGTFNFLRVAPNRHCYIIEKIPQGTRFEVVGQQDDYYAVILADGTQG